MKLKLVDKKDEAKGTKSFFFKPNEKVSYTSGEYIYITLPELKYEDKRGPTRHFTISSSPTEGSILRITTRVRPESGFKRTLDELPVGHILEGAGPAGVFKLDEKDTFPQVFLTGGIGITPFRSILKNAFDKNLDIDFTLIYSNSLPEEITFRDELEEWANSEPNFKLHMTITKPHESNEKWKGLTGRVNSEMIKKLTSDLKGPNFWVTGPPLMVDAMEEELEKLGISEERTRSEKFTGY